MPPKKAAASAKPASKAKSVKRKVDKENPEIEAQEEVADEVPEKKVKSRAAKKEKAPVEERPKLVRKAQTQTKAVEVEEELPEKKTRTKATAAKKETVEEAPVSDETKNGTAKKKVTKTKKAKDEDLEKAKDDVSEKKETAAAKKKAAAEEKKAAATKKKPVAAKGKKAKQVEAEEASESEPEEAQEEAAEVAPKARQRKAAAKKDEPVNKTATNWEAINFKCTSKNSKGNLPNCHITSWNVDGVRAWLKKGGLNILQYDQPDILCLQETKCSDEKLPDEVLNIEGYETHFASSEKDGYAGVGIASKIKPLSIKFGIDSEEHDSEGRCITAEYEKFYLINVYVPNAGRRLVTLPKRLDWNTVFKNYIKKLDEIKPVIICGDMNVAHEEIDLANPKTNTKNAGFTPEERQGMTEFLGDGYVDTFRKLYPDQEKAYTFWSYMLAARSKNIGWRLDYFIVSERIMDDICDNMIHSDVLGSDHCPLSLHFNL